MSYTEEVELKLEIPADCVARLPRTSPLRDSAAKSGKPHTLVSVYYDNKKQKLRRKRLSLRVRHVDGRYVQTIKKSIGRGGGSFARGEWENELDGERPDLDAARGTALEPLLTKKLRRSLKPVFETRVRRQTFPIKRGGSEIEVAIDKGKVVAGGQSSPLCEVELELKRGDVAEIFELARALGKEVPARLGFKSKAQRGYELAEGHEPRPVKAGPVALTPDMRREAAFQTIARACLQQVGANEPALRRGDLDGVHEMRVGLRRLRAAVSLFSDMLKGAQTEAMKTEFKWLAGELGPAREFDVFIKRVVRSAERERPRGSDIAPVARDMRGRRQQSLDHAELVIESARFRNLLLEAAAWIEAGDWTRKDDEMVRALRERPIGDAAAEELGRRRKKIRKHGARLAQLDPRRRHKLRIKCKKLRYACEFFAGAFAGKKSLRRQARFLSKLKKMQSFLGDLNDIMVHTGLTERIAEPRSRNGRNGAKKAFAAGRLSGREEARFASVMKDAERAFKAFIAARPFWT